MEELNKHFDILLKGKGNVSEEEKSFIFIKKHINANNRDEVLKIIERNKDNINILSLFGEMKLTGFMIEQNIEEGLKILKECSDKENSHAQYELGQYYFSNKFKEMTEAIHYFKKSTENGHSVAPFRLSSILYTNYGFRLAPNDSSYNEEKERKIKEKEKLINESIQYTIISAERGYSGAQFILGYDYVTGENVGKDMEKALHWLMESHKNGNQNAESSISYILKNNIEFYIKKCDEYEKLTKERNDLKKK